MTKRIDLQSGTLFGYLTVIEELPERAYGHRLYLCRCDCGNEKPVRATELMRGRTKSCGCKQSKGSTTHGKSKHHLHGRWENMHSRCNNPNNPAYKHYGGRGIVVCPRWKNFQSFLDDLEDSWRPGLILDRIDVNGDYTPKNVRWATRSISNKNTRIRGDVPARGVTRHTNGRYRAVVHLGIYDTIEEASAAYARAVQVITF